MKQIPRTPGGAILLNFWGLSCGVKSNFFIFVLFLEDFLVLNIGNLLTAGHGTSSPGFGDLEGWSSRTVLAVFSLDSSLNTIYLY